MKTLKFLTGIAIIATIFAGCSGKDGAPGAAGPTGAKGVANITSNTYTITPSSWSLNTPDFYQAVMTDNSITNMNTDVVIAYGSADETYWEALPARSTFNANDYVNYAYLNNTISIGDSTNTSPVGTAYLKVVVIPPAVMKQHPNTNWKDWGQVNAILETQKMNNQ